MRGRPAFASRAEGQAEPAVQADRAGRYVESARQVVQGIERHVDRALAFVGSNPVAELDAAKAEVLQEVVAGDVLALAEVRPSALDLVQVRPLGNLAFLAAFGLQRIVVGLRGAGGHVAVGEGAERTIGALGVEIEAVGALPDLEPPRPRLGGSREAILNHLLGFADLGAADSELVSVRLSKIEKNFARSALSFQPWACQPMASSTRLRMSRASAKVFTLSRTSRTTFIISM